MKKPILAALTTSLILGLMACSSIGDIGDMGKMVEDIGKTTEGLMGDDDSDEKKEAKPADKPAATPAAKQEPSGGGMMDQLMGGASNGNLKTNSSSSATCCVNGAFYNCGSAQDAAQCVGQPFKLMNCVSSCSDSSCEDGCINQHGPDPSSCQRDSSKDNTCKK